MQLPVLDVEAFKARKTNEEKRRDAERFVDELRVTCHGTGFCYLSGHGLPTNLTEGVMSVARQFFALPDAEKKAIEIKNSPHFRGCTKLGDERTKGHSDWREQIDIGPEEPSFALKPTDPPWMRLRGPNQWPASFPVFRVTVLKWMAAMGELAETLMEAVALALGQSVDCFDQFVYPEPYSRLKIIRYPAKPMSNDAGQGLGLHQDSGLLSLVLQDEVGGLQVYTDGGMIDVEPRPGALVMNLGEMLQAVSGGYFRATPHRVQSPLGKMDRISVAYFVNPRLDARLERIELPPELAARAVGGQNADPSDPVFACFGENTLKIRMRAHPDVTARYYGDVNLVP